MVNYQIHCDQLSASPLVSDAGQELTVAIWLPTEWVATHRIEKPAMAESKWLPLLPYLLEDRLLGDPSQHHCGVAAITDDGVDVHAVKHDIIKQILHSAAAQSIRVDALVPDFYALPWDGESAQLSVQEGRWLVRLGAHQGFAGQPQIVEELLLEWLEQDEGRTVVITNVQELPIADSITQRVTGRGGSINWQFAPLPDVNLLQGEHQPKSVPVWQKFTGYLRSGVWAVLVLVALGGLISAYGVVTARDINDLNRYRNYLAEQLIEGGSQLDTTSLAARIEHTQRNLERTAALRSSANFQLVATLERVLLASQTPLQSVAWRGGELTIVAVAQPTQLAALRRGLVNLPNTSLLALEINPQADQREKLTATLRWEGK